MTPINQSIELRFRQGNNVYCRFDTGAEYTTPLGATRNGQSLDGETLRVTQRLVQRLLPSLIDAQVDVPSEESSACRGRLVPCILDGSRARSWR